MTAFLKLRRPWDFGGAGTEQGFIFYMTFIRHRVGEYGARERGNLPLCRHWWAGVKPWMSLEEYAAAGSIPQGVEPLALARLYDYSMRETDAFDAPRNGRVATSALPRLVAAQRQARRMIEQHPHFADVFQLWQEHAWHGDGYAYHVTLPASPLAQ